MMDREQTQASILQNKNWDMVVIGGGITGAGVAREAARQGLSVLLLEQKDFAWGTSSRSSKMVHGGLRYLAMGDFKLTRHSVKERERLMVEAPGLVDIMSYCWPHYKKQFPGAFLFNVLLSAYDFFAGKRYRHFLNKQAALLDLPGIKEDGLVGSTRFADAVTDDARLVMRVLKEAQNDGAQLLNYCQVNGLIKEHDKVVGVKAVDEVSGQQYTINAKLVISATGAWADQLRSSLGKKKKIRPLRGSHLLIENWRLPVAQAITLQHPEDGRSMFIYPWEGMTVVGTTDLDNPELDLSEPYIRQDEVVYLLNAVNSLYPNCHIKHHDIVSTFSGVRPIVSSGRLNPSSEKRGHSVWDDDGLITVSGGKLTTFRLIALDVLKVAKKYLGHIDDQDHGQAIFNMPLQIPDELKKLDKQSARRLLGFYGQDIQLLCECAAGDWARVPGCKTYWAQVYFAARHEQVVNLDDLLLRRTRIGLFLHLGGQDFYQIIKRICQQEMHWDDKRWEAQWQRYQDIWHKYYSVPKDSDEILSDINGLNNSATLNNKNTSLSECAAANEY